MSVKTESQDVAVILLDKVKGKVSLQIVGDEELYGKDYVIEPKGNSSITANPGYTGEHNPLQLRSGINYCSGAICTHCTVCLFARLCTLFSALLLRILPALVCICNRYGGRYISSQSLLPWSVIMAVTMAEGIR